MSKPTDQKKIFVILPAFNEGKVLATVVEKLLARDFSVVVIDDGSTSLAFEAVYKKPIHFLQHGVNLGQGAALQTGIEYALTKNANYIVTFDADGQHDDADIDQLLAPLFNGDADITLGSRFMGARSTQFPAGRKWLLQCARWLNYLMTGLLLSDAHNGLRAMNRKAASAIHITQNRMAHATELISEIKKNKLRYKEIPVTVHYTEYSRGKGQSAWGSFRIFIDLIIDKIFK